MPITMERMLSVLDAAGILIDANDRWIELVRKAYTSDKQPGGRVAQAMEISSNRNATAADMRKAIELLVAVIDGIFPLIVTERPDTRRLERVLSEERAHFNINRKRIIINRNSQRLSRARTPTNAPFVPDVVVDTVGAMAPLQSQQELDEIAAEARRLTEEHYANKDKPTQDAERSGAPTVVSQPKPTTAASTADDEDARAKYERERKERQENDVRAPTKL